MGVANWIFDRVLPWRCLLCGGRAAANLCPGCMADLPWLEHGCSRCGIPLDALEGAGGSICGDCIRRPPPFDATVAALDYVFPTTVLARRFKFNRSLASGAALADCMLRALGSNSECVAPAHALVPVPLHPTRQIQRIYNQAELLARDIARTLDIPLATHVLKRVRRTPAQSGLSARERSSNLRGAFRVRRPPPARVALVDDVMTTGSTVRECARVLKQAGAETVVVWVAARAG